MITAKSGYWKDIQDAVDLVASMGGGDVFIPEGTWNFVDVNESWTGARVVIPAGVSLLGAPTERYPNGSVVEWKTVLQIPWDFGVPGDQGLPIWFEIKGIGDPNKPSRISDIKFVGYREFNESSTQVLRGIVIENVINFRIDHVYFRHIPEGIAVRGGCGVIDHCIFDNVYGWHGGTDWYNRTIGYGIAIDRSMSFSEWEPLDNLLGKYTNHTVFIEDNVFTRWRHCIVGNHGAHYVFRHNKIIGGCGFGEIDIHPQWNEPYVGGRCAEVYENYLANPEGWYGSTISSGSGVFFNNTLIGYRCFLQLYDAGWNPQFYPHDLYIWSNNLDDADPVWVSGNATEGEDYFFYAPLNYEPCPYPHPLTQE